METVEHSSAASYTPRTDAYLASIRVAYLGTLTSHPKWMSMKRLPSRPPAGQPSDTSWHSANKPRQASRVRVCGGQPGMQRILMIALQRIGTAMNSHVCIALLLGAHGGERASPSNDCTGQCPEDGRAFEARVR